MRYSEVRANDGSVGPSRQTLELYQPSIELYSDGEHRNGNRRTQFSSIGFIKMNPRKVLPPIQNFYTHPLREPVKQRCSFTLLLFEGCGRREAASYSSKLVNKDSLGN